MIRSLRILYHFYLEFQDEFKSFVKYGLNGLYYKLKILLYAYNMQMWWLFAYDYDFQKWEVQYYCRLEFGGHIPNFYFSLNLKLSGLNHRKRMGTQEDITLLKVYFNASDVCIEIVSFLLGRDNP